MQTMDQFSHDLTVALEETSKGVLRGRWGRRRTRSTGNLPCAPQPTEDSSSSPTDAHNEIPTNPNIIDGLGSVHSDSDDRHEFRLAFPKSRHNFESDSLNENFSPARFCRPNKMKERRKRKLKRMAVEYETTPSTPGPKNENLILNDLDDIHGTPTESNNNSTLPMGTGIGHTNSPFFPLTGAVKKRVLKHGAQDNYRTNFSFCGKRKRSHRDHRYHDHHDYYNKQHSSSVPRQSYIFTQKSAYPEHKTRTRSFSSAIRPNCEKILPLQKGLINKIERISASQQQQINLKPEGYTFKPIINNSNAELKDNLNTVESANIFKPFGDVKNVTQINDIIETSLDKAVDIFPEDIKEAEKRKNFSKIPESIDLENVEKNVLTKKLEMSQRPNDLNSVSNISSIKANTEQKMVKKKSKAGERRRRHKHHRLKGDLNEMRAQLQFEDPQSMECGSDLNDFGSSSSLSSTDSENGETNESDREGDDELTDWPGNEGVDNFSSKNDIKRKSSKKSLPLIKSSDDYAAGGDDDTLMSGDEVLSPPGSMMGMNFSVGLTIKPPMIQSQPITINPTSAAMNFSGGLGGNTCGSGSFRIESNSFRLSGVSLSGGRDLGSCNFGGNASGNRLEMDQRNFRFPVKQIESEMSGETSNPFLPSSPCQTNEVREIRAGCRRIREERPGFIVRTSVNERLAKFLQDAKKTCIRIPDLEVHEQESLSNLATLYSLQLTNDNGCAVLTKTSNTTQSVKIDQSSFSHKFIFNDYKRRCFETSAIGKGDFESQRFPDKFQNDLLLEQHVATVSEDNLECKQSNYDNDRDEKTTSLKDSDDSLSSNAYVKSATTINSQHVIS